jgi:hypothetical protein
MARRIVLSVNVAFRMCQLRSRRGPVGEFLVSGILPALSPNDIGRRG